MKNHQDRSHQDQDQSDKGQSQRDNRIGIYVHGWAAVLLAAGVAALLYAIANGIAPGAHLPVV